MTTSTQPTAMAAAIKLPQTVSSAKGVFDDLDALKLSLEDVGLTGATEVLMRVPVRKPMKHEYFRVRSGDENCFTTVLYEDKETREYYFVTSHGNPKLASDRRRFDSYSGPVHDETEGVRHLSVKDCNGRDHPNRLAGYLDGCSRTRKGKVDSHAG